MRKILSSIYKTVGHYAYPQTLIGFIAAETDQHLPEPTWQAYVCVLSGENEPMEKQYACNHGAKLSRTEAAGFFPQLDITKYKTR